MAVLAEKRNSIMYFPRVHWLGWELIGVPSGEWPRPLTRLECLELIFLSTRKYPI